MQKNNPRTAGYFLSRIGNQAVFRLIHNGAKSSKLNQPMEPPEEAFGAKGEVSS